MESRRRGQKRRRRKIPRTAAAVCVIPTASVADLQLSPRSPDKQRDSAAPIRGPGFCRRAVNRGPGSAAHHAACARAAPTGRRKAPPDDRLRADPSVLCCPSPPGRRRLARDTELMSQMSSPLVLLRPPAMGIKHPRREDEQRGADESADEVAEPAALHLDAEQTEQPGPDAGADHAEDDVDDEAHVAARHLLGQPAGENANENGRDPSDPCVFHEASRLQTVASKLARMSEATSGEPSSPQSKVTPACRFAHAGYDRSFCAFAKALSELFHIAGAILRQQFLAL